MYGQLMGRTEISGRVPRVITGASGLSKLLEGVSKKEAKERQDYILTMSPGTFYASVGTLVLIGSKKKEIRYDYFELSPLQDEAERRINRAEIENGRAYEIEATLVGEHIDFRVRRITHSIFDYQSRR